MTLSECFEIRGVEASEYLGLTLWAVRERIWAGDLP